MPVIKGEPTAVALSTEQRQTLLDQLSNEFAGKSTNNGPVIFEIPLEQSNKLDVLVVWQSWKGVRSEDRTNLILESYRDEKYKIAEALGVTYEEAMDQHLLPYEVKPQAFGNAERDRIHQAMLAEGGIPDVNGLVELHLPSMNMARAALRRLCATFPSAGWYIGQI